MVADEQKGEFFPETLMAQLRDKIAMVDHDTAGKRIYFENAGGALTLKACCEVACSASMIPDFPNRPTPGAYPMQKMIDDGIAEAKLLFGARSGSILCDLTVSKAIFTMTGVIMANVPGTNVVTTDLEHPSTYDSQKFFSGFTGKKTRVGRIDHKTGAVDVEHLLSLIDKDTCLLSLIMASNITGTINDVETIIREARKKNPEIYILFDCTQHMPHGAVDVEKLGVDAAGFAPYKILGKRGLGIGWVSDRVASLPHPHFLEGKVDDWDLGGYEPAGMAGLKLVNDYICWIGTHYTDSTIRREQLIAGFGAIERHERALMYRMLHGSGEIKGINDIDGTKIFFVDDLTKRDAILPMTIDNLEPAEAVKKYVENGIYLYHRSMSNKMSRRVLEGAAIPSVIRVSPMHYNTPQEVDRFLQVTAQIASGEI